MASALNGIESEEATMRWHHYVAYFSGGAFLTNAISHLGLATARRG